MQGNRTITTTETYRGIGLHCDTSVIYGSVCSVWRLVFSAYVPWCWCSACILYLRASQRNDYYDYEVSRYMIVLWSRLLLWIMLLGLTFIRYVRAVVGVMLWFSDVRLCVMCGIWDWVCVMGGNSPVSFAVHSMCYVMCGIKSFTIMCRSSCGIFLSLVGG